KLIPDLFEMSLSRVQVDTIAGIPVLDVQERPFRSIARASKRAVDLVLAALLLVLSAPLLLILAALVNMESEGPAFIRQERVGLRGRRFRCLKFRTMLDGSDELQ